MGPLSFAFSVHNFISSVGADAGFAAIVGLAVLVLLYFAHARETANLREEAAALSERLQQAEAAVDQLSRAQSAAPAPPPASVQVTDRRPSPQPAVAAPFAPAGMGAPALAAATRVVPAAHAPASPAHAPASPAPAPASPAPTMTPPQPSPAPAAEPTRAPSPQPAVAAAASAGATSAAAVSEAAPAESVAPSGIPRPATAAGANGSTRQPPLGAGASASARPAGPASVRTLPPLEGSRTRRSSTGRRIALAVGALLVVAAAVALVAITATGSSSPNKTGAPQTTNAPTPITRGAGGFKPASVTVSVLNGTSTNELAHRVAAKLAGSGYKPGRVATASNQTETKTVVAYLPGSTNRRAALHVASALKLAPGAVQPIDQATQQVACPPPSACQANVVVTVGADLATL